MVVFFMVLLLSCIGTTNASGNESLIIKFYQDHISAVDGNRCPMHPTCSSFASQAFEEHGPVVGWIMTLDRLVRCGRDESILAGEIIVENQKYIYDPIEANDFWWVKKTK